MNKKELKPDIITPMPARMQTDSDWRELVLFRIMIAASLVGLVALGFYLPTLLSTGLDFSAGLYLAACMILFILTLLRRIPYPVRAVSLGIIIFIVSVTSLLKSGFLGSGHLFLLMLPLISSILLGTNAGIVALILTIATVAMIGFLVPGEEVWFTPIFTYIPISTIATFVLIFLVQRLDWSVKTAKSMSDQMAAERAQLEKRVFERTQVLERRLTQIYTAAEISRTISAVLDRQSLLQQVVDLVQNRFELYYVGVFLVDDQQEYAVLQAGTGEAGQKMIAEGHRLKIGGTSMVGWAVANREPRITLDVGTESVHFRNPYLPLTLSEMALPLISGPRVLGAMTIQSGQPDAFDQDDITVLKAIADTLATALENADLFNELESRLEEIRALHAQYLIQAWTEASRLHGDLSFIYKASAQVAEAGHANSMQFPLTLRGQPIGHITINAEHEQLSSQDLAFVEAVANEAAIALENARLLEENQRRAQQEHLLGEISARAQQYMDLDMVMKTAVQDVKQALKAPRVRIRLNSEISPSNPISNDGEEMQKLNERLG